MPVNNRSKRAEAKRPDTHRIVRRQTTVHSEFALVREQLKSLGADMFALKTLLPALLSRVGRLDPILASAIHHGFRDATDQVQHLMASRKAEIHERCRNALASTIRAAVLLRRAARL